MPLINLVVIVNARLVGAPAPEVVPFHRLNRCIREFGKPVLSGEQIETVVETLTAGK